MANLQSRGTPPPPQRTRRKEFIEDTMRDALKGTNGLVIEYRDEDNLFLVGLDPLVLDVADIMKKSEYDSAPGDGIVDMAQRLDEFKEPLPVSTNGQTDFTLTRTPLQPVLSELIVNSQQMRWGIDYTISGATLTWVSSDFDLETTDELEITYR